MRGCGACVMACWSYGGRVVGVCPMGECGRTRCTSESGSCPLSPSPTPSAPRPYHPHDRQHRPHRQRHPLRSVAAAFARVDQCEPPDASPPSALARSPLSPPSHPRTHDAQVLPELDRQVDRVGGARLPQHDVAECWVSRGGGGVGVCTRAWVWCMCDGVLVVWRESCRCVSDGRVRSHSVHV